MQDIGIKEKGLWGAVHEADPKTMDKADWIIKLLLSIVVNKKLRVLCCVKEFTKQKNKNRIAKIYSGMYNY